VVASDTAGIEELPAEVAARAAAVFGLLASGTRLRLLWLLMQGESDVSALAAGAANAVSTVSENLAMLRSGGLVRSRREGRRVVYAVEGPAVAAVEAVVRGMVHRSGGAAGDTAAPGRDR